MPEAWRRPVSRFHTGDLVRGPCGSLGVVREVTQRDALVVWHDDPPQLLEDGKTRWFDRNSADLELVERGWAA